MEPDSNDEYVRIGQRGISDILAWRPANPPWGGRCLPYFYPEVGDNVRVVDHDPQKHYYVLGNAHCGGGVFTSIAKANRETHNFEGFVRKAVDTWAEVEVVWREFHDEHHTDSCPEFTLPPDFIAPTPVYFNGSIRTAIASLLPLVSPSVCSPPPCPSTFTPWTTEGTASRAPPSPKIQPPSPTLTRSLKKIAPVVRSRPPVTPQPGTQPAPRLGSPFSPAVPSSVGSPSPLRPSRFPTISPLADLGSTPPPPTLYRSPMYNAYTSPTAPPSSSSRLSNVSDVLSDMSSMSSGVLSDMELPSTTTSPRSSPRTLSAIDLSDDEDEYAGAFGADDDELYEPRLMWAVKGLRYGSWADPRDAVAAAMAQGMGGMFTLISSVDETELAAMHSWGAVAPTHPAASGSG
ncbi:hypothetical protein R3P38DRAFT_3240325 [Favolaschia claudopus]|uniref:Uncharacterized protein n=1 Tax=Favolaschia claudopus TaxID=2862362 RepID=A0AAV9Z793_9AGAR